MVVMINVLTHGKVPAYFTPDSAALDCYAAEPAIVPMRGRVQVSLGFVIAIPEGYHGQLLPLDSMAIRDGVFAIPQTISPDYGAPIAVLLANHSDWPREIAEGDRVCQLLIAPTTRVVLSKIGDLNDPNRRPGSGASKR
jgi:dUTP pyrophosphatase